MTSTVRELRTLAVGRREWIPSCSANLQISLETDGNGGTSSGYFVTVLVSSTTQLRNGWRDGQSVVHESGHGVQE